MISTNKKYSPSFGHDVSKSFESLFSTVKIQVRKLAGSLLYGKISDGHHLSMHSQRTDLRGSGTWTYNGQGIYWTGPNPQECPGEWC